MATAEYENDNDVSVQMHEAVLPRRLPVLPCFDVGAAYLLASTATGAGSDWFDVVPAANGAVVVVVGDVAGRGVDAVATMSQLRTSLREHLRVGHDLLSALEATNSLAADLDGGTAATVCVASFEPGPGKVVYCTAGHPAPLVVGLDGTASHLPPTGAGALATGGTFAFGEHRLQPGELFVLYTDGVLQTHAGPVHDRLDAVARSVAAAFAAGGGGHGIRGCVDLVCERVLTTVASIGALHDDAAVVAVEPMPQHRALELELTAGPTTSETARAALDEWLHELCVRELDEVATLHALGELVANAAEHAYWDRHPPRPVLSRCGRRSSRQVRSSSSSATVGAGARAGRGVAVAASGWPVRSPTTCGSRPDDTGPR